MFFYWQSDHKCHWSQTHEQQQYSDNPYLWLILGPVNLMSVEGNLDVSDLIWELLTIDHLNWRLNNEKALNQGTLNGDSTVFVIIMTTNHLMTGVQPTPKSIYYQMYLR